MESPAPPGAADRAGAPVVTDNPVLSRFELHVAGELAGFVDYRLHGRDGRDGQVINLIHTEVDPRFQGAGYATVLARASLDAARERHLAVLPTCPYIRSWIAKHPSYVDLVPAERRTDFGL
ncbi:GNAT family N-acetyltransferase [Trebonia sp.]|uniref:GNAT family N-acetyltransferase n=1 Tax=Trebonia sp. TaxID=2767075 RepID=UPI002617931E|nr:GNAT family N-acetyltransferase [Trebonia sp.]